jgi:hypothetical protein
MHWLRILRASASIKGQDRICVLKVETIDIINDTDLSTDASATRQARTDSIGIAHV